jgi:hypothetical protein
MTNKLQTTAVAFLIFLSTLCSAQIPKAKVLRSLSNQDVIEVFVAFPNGRILDLTCNVREIACEMPLAGTEVSVLTGHDFSYHIYAGPEAHLTWDNEYVGAYVIRASN